MKTLLIAKYILSIIILFLILWIPISSYILRIHDEHMISKLSRNDIFFSLLLIFSIVTIYLTISAKIIFKNSINIKHNSKNTLDLNITEYISDAIVIIDKNANIFKANTVLLKLLGYSQKDLIGKPLKFILNKDKNETNNVLKFKNTEATCLHKDGRKIPVIISQLDMPNEYGEKICTIVTIKDISRFKEIESELKQANIDLTDNERAVRNMLVDLQKTHGKLQETQGKLIQSEKLAAIGQLSAGIAHEINNPIGFIGSNLDILEHYIKAYKDILHEYDQLKISIENSDFEKANTIVDLISKKAEEMRLSYINQDIEELVSESKEGAYRIGNIVADLRTFCREGKGSVSLIKLEDVIDDAIHIVGNEIKYKAKLIKDYGQVAQVKANSQRLSQVFLNLLINSIQAIDKNSGIIEIKTFSDQNYVCVSIRDTGEGIPDDKINRIFEPFYTTKPVGIGTGLGLSISHEVVKNYGGEILVKSEVGSGTIFTVRLPAAKETVKS